jgi:hypothetical protein
VLTDSSVPTVILGFGAGVVIIATSIAALSGVAADRQGVASALLNVSRQLGGALGLAAISTVITDTTARSATAGKVVGVALTAGFRTGFAVSAALVLAAAVTAAVLLREEGRGQRINLMALQAAGD